MEIYLIKSGGQREGPFGLAEINRQLVARRYKDTDYWAWYDGLAEWVPLYNVPGIVSLDDTSAWVMEEKPSAPSQASPAPTVADSPSTVEPPAEPAAASAPPARQFSSGLPFAALEPTSM